MTSFTFSHAEADDWTGLAKSLADGLNAGPGNADGDRLGFIYVTDMMGFGFNAVTGDFSRGASGFWIERGERKFPVSEVTISLNLDDLLKRIDAVADDLDFRTSMCTPTFRVSSMTVAGR